MMRAEAATEAAKVAPPVTVSAAHVVGYPINDLVAVATLVYVLLMIGLLIPKYWREIQRWRRGDVSDD